jgi:predicted acetyltransferase
MLAAAVAYCRENLGLTSLLVTCAAANNASQRVIEANGGVFEDVEDGEFRYWIEA